ncbi:MAG: ribosomal-processing cysteine protease Prp [Clostridiales bacterium]|nr:ribosomal-processing cysteine protease Prp [Clostridiales bacterium]
MIRAEFTRRYGVMASFEVSGHAMQAPSGQDLLCAAVSSVCYYVANTAAEVIRADAAVQADEGYMKLEADGPAPEALAVLLEGLALHLEQLRQQYPHDIKVIISEV